MPRDPAPSGEPDGWTTWSSPSWLPTVTLMRTSVEDSMTSPASPSLRISSSSRRAPTPPPNARATTSWPEIAQPPRHVDALPRRIPSPLPRQHARSRRYAIREAAIHVIDQVDAWSKGQGEDHAASFRSDSPLPWKTLARPIRGLGRAMRNTTLGGSPGRQEFVDSKGQDREQVEFRRGPHSSRGTSVGSPVHAGHARTAVNLQGT